MASAFTAKLPKHSCEQRRFARREKLLGGIHERVQLRQQRFPMLHQGDDLRRRVRAIYVPPGPHTYLGVESVDVSRDLRDAFGYAVTYPIR